ncbi:MAG TPA: CARDB domain-containing protein [Thiobacillaceae bacterium]|nr:CARDB domain-containing protein [Thiobacillaceae bacterium]
MSSLAPTHALPALLSALTLALFQAGFISANAAEGAYYDPSNPASSSGRTSGYELTNTIGCPGKGILDAGCQQPKPVQPVKKAEPKPLPPVVESKPAPKPAPAPVAAPVVKSGPISMDTGARLATGPIMSEQTVTALVKDKDGNPVPDARVEWTLANAPGMVGDILRASDDAKRASSDFAITETNSRGEASLTLTSPVEGITHILAYTPDIKDAAASKSHVIRQWVDAAWLFPPEEVTAKVGTAQTLTTKVVRQSTGEPLAGYEVNWEIVEGPNAYFANSRLPTATTLTDANGVASVQLMQTEPRGGSNTVEVDVGRAGDAATTCCPLPTGTFAEGKTRANWLAPELALKKSCPASVYTGEAGKFDVTVSNPGKVGADSVLAKVIIPEGMKVVNTGGGQVMGNVMAWSLGGLEAGASKTVSYTAQAARVGTYGFGSAAASQEGLSADGSCNVNVIAADLNITKTCPAEALVGDKVEYTVNVTNKGSGEATNVVVKDVVPGGMKHDSGQPTVEWKVGNLAPGASASEKFTFTAEQMGSQINTAKVSADRDLSGAAQCLTEVKKPGIDVEKSGPDKRFLGRPATYGITAGNPGNAAASNVVVTDVVPVGMTFKSASEGGSYDAATRTVTWKLGSLAAGATAKMDVTMVGDNAGKPCNVATITADRGLTDSAQACTEVAGIPALLLEVVDSPDPVEVGTSTTYTIRVTNQGTADATNVVIQSMLADGQELTSATGATAATATGNLVRYAPVAVLAPGQVVEYKVDVKAVKAAGDVRFRTMMTADQLTDAVREEESTRLY